MKLLQTLSLAAIALSSTSLAFEVSGLFDGPRLTHNFDQKLDCGKQASETLGPAFTELSIDVLKKTNDKDTFLVVCGKGDGSFGGAVLINTLGVQDKNKVCKGQYIDYYIMNAAPC